VAGSLLQREVVRDRRRQEEPLEQQIRLPLPDAANLIGENMVLKVLSDDYRKARKKSRTQTQLATQLQED